MFVWLIKQLLNIRKVLDGRKHPHQLAWALALGFLVGIVPHGNLLAVALIAIVLCLRVNHSLAALTGVTTALLAWKLDPLTHRIGSYLLSDPRWHDSLMTAWQWPLVPWTDLNNTVVAGSLALGTAMVLPLYAASYPFFRLIRPEVKPAADEDAVDENAAAAELQPSERLVLAPDTVEPTVEWLDSEIPAPALDARDSIKIEKPVDVIRLAEYAPDHPSPHTDAAVSDDVQINQALGYLLRRLRDSKQGDVA